MTPAAKAPGPPPVEPCTMFVVEGYGPARKCGAPATTTRTIGRLTFVMCERCAAAFDVCLGEGAA